MFKRSLIFLILFIVFYLDNSPGAIALLEFFFTLIFIIYEIKRDGIRGINPITAFALYSLLSGLGNYLGYRAWLNQVDLDIFLIYAIPDNFFTANSISFLGTFCIISGWELAQKFNFRFRKITAQKEFNLIFHWLFILALAIRVIFSLGLIPPLGALTDIFILIPLFAIFYLSRIGTMNNNRTLLNMALILTLIEVFNSMLFSYLRFPIIQPMIAYIIGFISGRNTQYNWFSIRLIPVYVLLVFFLSYFNVFGKERAFLGVGIERISHLVEAKSARIEDEPSVLKSLTSRRSNFNQLTNVVALVKEFGFYKGETMSYVSYAFIPRFLWPAKPTIAQGRWFALEIGQARVLDSGGITNSINMTIPGELYLNYSWLGVIIGSLLSGFIFFAFWATTDFWQAKNDILGNYFGLFLIFRGLGGIGPDLQIFVTLLAYYLLLLVISIIFRNI